MSMFEYGPLYVSAVILFALVGMAIRDAWHKPVARAAPSGGAARSGLLDGVKGVTIINIIFIHSVWWSGQMYMPHDIIRQSALVIDVPIFFFISGMVARSRQITVGLMVRRFLRLYIPFAVLILFLSLAYWIWSGIAVPTDVFLRWLALRIDGWGAGYSAWACVITSLWFLQVFFIIFFLSPLLHALLSMERIRYVVLAVLILFVVTFSVSPSLPGDYRVLDWIPMSFVTFYAAFYSLGFIFKDAAGSRMVFLLLLTGESLAVWGCLALQDFTFDLQGSKFPPGLLYFLVSLVPVTLVLYVYRFYRNIGERCSSRWLVRFLEGCGENVYSIYLFQGFGAMIGYPVARLLAAYRWGTVLAAVFLVNLTISLALGYLFRKITNPLLTRLDAQAMRLFE